MKFGAAAMIGLGLLGLAGCDRTPATTEVEPATAPSTEPPKRAAGLWRQMSTLDGGPPITTSICLDAETDQKLSLWGSQSDASNCEEHSFERGADGAWTMTTVCRGDAGSSVTIRGRASGDFVTRYQVSMETTAINPASPELAGTHRFTTDAERVGDCPPDMAPGMIEIPGAGRIDALTAGQQQ